MSARGPYAKGLAKRDEILQAALELFAVKGYDRVSVREIARQCGLSQAGLLHHFSNKEELFLEVLQRRDDSLGGEGEPDHTHSVGRLIDAVQRNTGQPGLVRLFVTMSAESVEQGTPAHSFFASRYHWLIEHITDDVLAHRPDDTVEPDLSPEDVARLLVAVADGLQLQWLLDPDRVDMPRLLRVMADVLAAAPEPVATDR